VALKMLLDQMVVILFFQPLLLLAVGVVVIHKMA
jgi:hypothetical protein